MAASRRLFLIWKADLKRGENIPIGYVRWAGDHFSFSYILGAVRAQGMGFQALPEFSDFQKEYHSRELFPLFANRVMSPRRGDYGEFIRLLGLEHSESPLFAFEILDRTGGQTQADRFRMFLEPEVARNQPFELRFFVAGQSRKPYAQSDAIWENMSAGELLALKAEPTNSHSKTAVQICSGDLTLGYVPDYYSSAMIHPMLIDGYALDCRLVRVNRNAAPQDRILVSVAGVWPDIALPFYSGDYAQLQVEIAGR